MQACASTAELRSCVFDQSSKQAILWSFKLQNLLLEVQINILLLLDVQTNLPETSQFFVCPNGFGERLFSTVYSTWDV
jgi:hypothetical protein